MSNLVSGFFLLLLCLVGNTLSCFACTEGERQALLRFKLSLTYPALLSSWVGKDCCKWKGVLCNGTTTNAHVVKLDLRNTNLSVDIRGEMSSTGGLEAHELNSSLVELKYLNYLDLSWNSFQYSPIPGFLGSMKRLRYLYLSHSDFAGVVPHQLGNLSSLRVLDLSSYGGLIVDDFSWVGGLSSLQLLDMGTANISDSRSLMKVLGMLPSLLSLRLSGCGLVSNNIHISDRAYFANSTLPRVRFLDLRNNSFEGKLPYFLANMTSLSVLDLSYNNFSSSIPLVVGNLKSLTYLNLGENKFDHVEGGLSTILLNQCQLRYLYMFSNSFGGQLIGANGNMSGCSRYEVEMLYLGGSGFGGPLPDWLGQFSSLTSLFLHGNQFTGSIPTSFGRLTALETLYLSNNQLTGAIPASIGRMAALRELSLSHNQLNGTIPTPIGQLSKLEYLYLANNSLEGVVSEAHLANLSMLKRINLNSNFILTLKTRSDWVPPFQLTTLSMSSCKVGSLPQWLRTQKEIPFLFFENSSISGTLPEWLPNMNYSEVYLSKNNISGQFQNFRSNIRHLDLSQNSISGPLPDDIGDVMPKLVNFLFADNLLNGTIPNSLCKMKRLVTIDLSRNRLSGNVPDCWMNFTQLNGILLSSNRLSGIIPRSLARVSSLTWLQLSNNTLRGGLPFALGNCTNLKFLDLGENRLSENVPDWIGENLKSLQVLRLRKNNFGGGIPPELCRLQSLTVIDLGSNNLTGKIPACLSNLTGMVTNGSTRRNSSFYVSSTIYQQMMAAIKGAEIEYTSTLGLLVIMDLSSNKLEGEIPEELTRLSGLLGLNLSHNHLTGSIPDNVGGLKSLMSLDLSNNHLSGKIPLSLGALTSMSHLNLSYNNLSGPIPTGSQLQTLNDPYIYAGNSELCGAPLQKCLSDEPSQPPATTSDRSYKVWFYVNIMSGFATGFWGVVGVLLFKKRWRHAFFRLVEATYDKILVAVQVRVARLKLKINQVEG
ncbi:hypothetical protein RJ640_004085 [Escallonia rubra]|uniref:Leucine-rich repeat-containing N-terminal plant-type domain-containing protein n=1 Tax=Escallonia rubra TaxID=112253 RepID=A0AA88U0U5_9ASTE|nr:hypothetical protein RJ640_004085 [Escallonia rubra]